MRVPAAAVALAAALAGCGGAPMPDAELWIRVTAGVAEADFGSPFPVTVVRGWSRDVVPAEWDDRALLPLTVRLDGVERREDAARVEETLRFTAHAFCLGAAEVRPPEFVARPRAGGADVRAACDGVTIRVRPALDPAAPGDVELPGAPQPPSRTAAFAAAGIVAAGIAAWAVLRRRRRAASAPAPAVGAEPAAGPAPPDARATALGCIARLRTERPRTDDEVQRFHVEASGALRGWVEARFAVRAPEMTTEEIAASGELARGAGTAPHASLVETLAACDAVKFARFAPDDGARAGLLDAAERFVRATSAEDGP